jgi:hypothetical protein
MLQDVLLFFDLLVEHQFRRRSEFLSIALPGDRMEAIVDVTEQAMLDCTTTGVGSRLAGGDELRQTRVVGGAQRHMTLHQRLQPQHAIIVVQANSGVSRLLQQIHHLNRTIYVQEGRESNVEYKSKLNLFVSHVGD